MEPDTKEQASRVEERTAKLIYLASPYSGDNVEHNYARALHYVAFCARQRDCVYSPIVHWHEAAKKYELRTDCMFWWPFNTRMIEACDEVWVLTLPDWRTSVGVKKEVDFAELIGKPVIYRAPL